MGKKKTKYYEKRSAIQEIAEKNEYVKDIHGTNLIYKTVVSLGVDCCILQQVLNKSYSLWHVFAKSADREICVVIRNREAVTAS